jgi:hypothetical protein
MTHDITDPNAPVGWQCGDSGCPKHGTAAVKETVIHPDDWVQAIDISGMRRVQRSAPPLYMSRLMWRIGGAARYLWHLVHGHRAYRVPGSVGYACNTCDKDWK